MRLTHSKPPLPRTFTRHPKAKGIELEKDLKIGASRLRAKLLIFKTRLHLRTFWRDVLHKSDLGRRCYGAVNGLVCEVQTVGKNGNVTNKKLVADARYFCVIGLVKHCMSAEIVTHEAIHAGFCYAKRIKRSPWDTEALRMDEETVAYPAGEIAAKINDVMWRNKPTLLTKRQKREMRNG